MPIAMYRKSFNAYVLEQTLFKGEPTYELFKEVKNKREAVLIKAAYIGNDSYPAFNIAGLSEDLKVLDAALILSGLKPLVRSVEMFIVNIPEEIDLLLPVLQASDVLNAKLNNVIGEP